MNEINVPEIDHTATMKAESIGRTKFYSFMDAALQCVHGGSAFLNWCNIFKTVYFYWTYLPSSLFLKELYMYVPKRMGTYI